MSYNAKRKRPSAYPIPPAERSVKNDYHGRTVALSTGRGDVTLTPVECRELAAELVRAAETTEGERHPVIDTPADPSPAKPAWARKAKATRGTA